MGTQGGTGRKRGSNKEKSTAEDDALNLIAREAEARLAAKRAARAEAREIRMKELERQQKEIFQVQKKYYGLETKAEDKGDDKFANIEQWMEESERYSRSSRITDESDRYSRSSRIQPEDSERYSRSSRIQPEDSERYSRSSRIQPEDSERYSRSSRIQPEDNERYSRSSRIQPISDDDERMSVGSRSSVMSDLDGIGVCGGGSSASRSHKKSKKKKKSKHKDRDSNGYDDESSVMSSRSSRLSDESRASRSSKLDLTSSRLIDDTRASRSSRLDLQPASYASSDLYSPNGLSSSRQGLTYNGYQFSGLLSHITYQRQRRSSLYEDSLYSGSRRVTGSNTRPSEYTSYRGPSSRTSSRASSARTSPVDDSGSVASYRRSTATGSIMTRDLDDVTIPDFSDVEGDYLEKGSRAASVLTAGTLTSLGGTSSRRGSVDTAIDADAETSIREIKEIHELKDQIQDVETKYMQNLKEVKDALVAVDEKYRKAMVSNAQLDNEKNNLMYQVDTLKDSLMELEELLSESRRECDDKVKEHEREKQAHNTLQFQYNQLKDTLEQSEEMLNEIRQLKLKQDGFTSEISDLNETVEWKDKKIGALERQKEYTDTIRIERDELRDETVQLKDILKKHGIVLGPDLSINGGVEETDGQTQDSQTSPTEGNSVLGRGQEPQLGSSGAEKLDSQHQETFEEPKESLLSSTAPCSLAIVSGDKTSHEEQQINLSSVRDSVEEVTLLKKDSDEDIPITDAQNTADTVSEVGEVIAVTEEKVTGVEVNGVESTKKGDLVDTGEPETDAKTVTVDDSEPVVNEMINDIREMTKNDLSEDPATTPEEVETVELNMRSIDSSARPGEITENTMNEDIPDDSAPVGLITEPHIESESAEEEAGNEEPKELPANPQPQSTAAAGKKKKKKKKKSKKKKGGPQEEEKQSNGAKEKSMPEKIESMTHKGNATQSSPFETPNEPEMDQLTNEQDRQEVDAVMSVPSPDNESSVTTTNLIGQLKGSISAGDHNAKSVSSIENSKDIAESPGETDALNAEPEISDRSKDESVSVNEVNSEPPTDNQVNRTDTTDSTANIEAELHDPSNTEVTSVQSEAISNSESKKNNLHLTSNTDIFFDCVDSLPGSKVPLESDQTTTVMSGTKDQTDTQSSVEGVLDIMEMVNKEDEPTLELETKSFPCNDGNDGDHSMLSQEETGKDPELNVGLMEPENCPQSDCTDPPTENLLDESSEKSCNVYVDKQCGSDTIMSEHVDHASGPTESQGLSMLVFVGEKEAKETDLETEQGDATDIPQTSDLAKENGPQSDCTDPPTENLLDESSEKSCNVYVDKQCGSDTIMSEHVDHASGPTESQGLSMLVFVGEKEAKETDLETEQGDATDIPQTSDLAKENGPQSDCTDPPTENLLDESSEKSCNVSVDKQCGSDTIMSEHVDHASGPTESQGLSMLVFVGEKEAKETDLETEQGDTTDIPQTSDLAKENGPKSDCTDPPTENLLDESSEKSCNVSVDKQCGSDTIMSEHVDHASGPTESQGLSMLVFVGEKEAKETDLETEQGDATDIPQTSDLAKEAAKTGSFTEHDHSDEALPVDEDGQSLNGCEVSEDNKPSPAHQQDPVEEYDEEGDEGLSFDFDDMDLDPAENVPSKNQVAEPETDLEVTPVEVNHANTELGQGDVLRPQEEAQLQVASLEEPVESDQEKPTIHDTPDEDLDSVSQDHQLSSDIETVLAERGENESEEEQHTIERETSGTDGQAHVLDEPVHGLDEPVHGSEDLANGSEDPANASDEPVHGSEEPVHGSEEPEHGSERGSGNAGELGVVESNSVEEGKQEVVLVEKEEGVKVIEQNLEFLQNTADQASSKKESPPSRKDPKKNGKKGKSKGKEDCKMS